jgi:hypothetical protein
MGRIRVGTPDTTPDAPTHVLGVRKGNEEAGYKSQMGHKKDGKADARRSTGIRPKTHNPILKIMPNLPPG